MCRKRRSGLIGLGCSSRNDLDMCYIFCFFVFIESATTKIYTLSLHDALSILLRACDAAHTPVQFVQACQIPALWPDRKSTRLNSSHMSISYAVFCLKKKRSQVRNYASHLRIRLVSI